MIFTEKKKDIRNGGKQGKERIELKISSISLLRWQDNVTRREFGYWVLFGIDGDGNQFCKGA